MHALHDFLMPLHKDIKPPNQILFTGEPMKFKHRHRYSPVALDQYRIDLPYNI